MWSSVTLNLKRLIWEVLGLVLVHFGDPGPGFGHFWAYFTPTLAHLCAPGPGFGPFRGSWAWIWA